MHIRTLQAMVIMVSILAVSMLAGCTSDLPDGFPADGKYHPENFVQYEQHGYAFHQGALSCTRCHGENYDGGVAEVCCTCCHAEVTDDWKKDCTFCHGGRDNDSGAPPKGLRDEMDRSMVAVGAHTAHVSASDSFRALDCGECHTGHYTSFVDEGHIDADGRAEVKLGALAGNTAAYDPDTAGCSSVYCHGGKDVSWTSEDALNCASCHGSKSSPEGLSGKHASHLGVMDCGYCHGDLITMDGTFANKDLHADGKVSVKLFLGEYNADEKTCANSCHGAAPIAWEGNVHPNGWVAPAQHAFAYYDAPDSCAACHGDDLGGGTSADSCDACHTGGTDAWRTSCVFCHGGTDNNTGAPPETVRGETDSSLKAVGAHSAHVTEAAWHAGFDCSVCHVGYTAFDDEGHIDTQAGAEVVFSGAAGDSGVYVAATGSCSSIQCHGNGIEPSGELPWTGAVPMDCNSCHAFDDDAARSGFHDAHGDFACDVCHGATVDGINNFVDKSLHMNGQPDVQVVSGTWNPVERSCTDSCHIGVRPWGE